MTKTKGWCSVGVAFNKNRWVKWQTIRVPKNSGKKRMEFRIRQIIGYIRNFGKAVADYYWLSNALGDRDFSQGSKNVSWLRFFVTLQLLV